MLTAAICGDCFASPPVEAILSVCLLLIIGIDIYIYHTFSYKHTDLFYNSDVPIMIQI